jgi:hypothetical protein
MTELAPIVDGVWAGGDVGKSGAFCRLFGFKRGLTTKQVQRLRPSAAPNGTFGLGVSVVRPDVVRAALFPLTGVGGKGGLELHSPSSLFAAITM